MKTLFSIVVLLILAGCSSLQNAGQSEYTVRPFVVDGKVMCCELMIRSGREIEGMTAHVVKTGDDFTIDFEIRGVKAFEGQAISAEAAGAIVPGISSGASGWLAK